MIGSVALGAFIAGVDVPMYLRRWRAGRAAGERYPGFSAGLRDAITRRVPTRSWAVWRSEVAWLSGYFSFGVWLSQALIWLPRG